MMHQQGLDAGDLVTEERYIAHYTQTIFRIYTHLVLFYAQFAAASKYSEGGVF